MALGDLVVGWLLLRQAEVALDALDAGASGARPGVLRGQGRRGPVLRADRAARADARPPEIVETTDNALMDLPEESF